jgi:hypothetical protein
MDYNESLEKLPLFVSFPRSGCNWMQPVMELYFNRHRMGKAPSSPTWMEGPVENPMWTHTHDPNGTITTKLPAVFFWRHPTNAIYSLSQLMHQSDRKSIERFCNEYKRLYDRWARPEDPAVHGGAPVLVVQYENVLINPHSEMKRISEFFGQPFDKERSEMAFKTAGDKSTTNSKGGPANFKNPRSGTETYEMERIHFYAQWNEEILGLTGMTTKCATIP